MKKINENAKITLTFSQLKKLIKEARSYNSMSNTEAACKMYLLWAGVENPGHEGLSSNPKAQRLDNFLYEKLGDEWYDLWGKIQNHHEKLSDEFISEHPEFERPTRINIFKVGKELSKQMIPWIEKLLKTKGLD